MLHLHFGAGRLGLGLVVPAFQSQQSETFVLNRSVSGSNDTGATSLTPTRRNDLLGSEERSYLIQKPGGTGWQRVTYDGFTTYDAGTILGLVEQVILSSNAAARGIVLTASVLKPENYGAVVQALNVAATLKEQRAAIGPIFLVACENTVSAQEVIDSPMWSDALSAQARNQVVCADALVDRLCVGMDEVEYEGRPYVRVCAEGYASLKLALRPATEPLVELCRGSMVEFSRHLEVEKQIKGWLLNGSHWLIALQAFQASNGDRKINLNEYIASEPAMRRFASEVMEEMREGVALHLKSNPEYSAFLEDVDVESYLQGAATRILERFDSTDDPITRILARFQAPSREAVASIEAFSKRFSDRIKEPMMAYEAEKGSVPPAVSRGLFSLFQLVASGTFIDAHAS